MILIYSFLMSFFCYTENHGEDTKVHRERITVN